MKYRKKIIIVIIFVIFLITLTGLLYLKEKVIVRYDSVYREYHTDLEAILTLNDMKMDGDKILLNVTGTSKRLLLRYELIIDEKIEIEEDLLDIDIEKKFDGYINVSTLSKGSNDDSMSLMVNIRGQDSGISQTVNLPNLLGKTSIGTSYGKKRDSYNLDDEFIIYQLDGHNLDAIMTWRINVWAKVY